MENTNSTKQRKVAVLVGCNYANTKNELRGCINDVVAMHEILVQRFGFEEKNIQVLTDAAESKVLPTGINIKAALNRMIDEALPEDVLFFHYSGHGTRIPSVKPAHPFRSDEAIVPCDFNLITDVDFREMVNRIPKGASFTMLSDSCHSGGLIDKEKEQIGPFASIKDNISPILNSFIQKTIPFDSVLQHLQSLTKINTQDIGTHLLESFGGNASLKFRLPPPLEMDIFKSLKGDEGILLSGCQANETSADIQGGGGKPHGAFTYAVQEALKDWPIKGLSNREVVMKAREVLKSQGLIEQHPCLYCSDDNANAVFLCQSSDQKKASSSL
ncbi:metacaspase-9-like [Rutidosis leptorrhynchoides]|uniref:metacaspase-9-like n=1 Tax=Rutidosis leptorrhynchoides TaxID=125765 RepID=UPI003A99BA91